VRKLPIALVQHARIVARVFKQSTFGPEIAMNSATRACTWWPRAITVIGLAAMGGTALAQQTSAPAEVKVQADKVVTVKNKHSPTGIQQETVQLTHTVNYADLDLTTAAGKSELENRIHSTASLICKQLGTMYPAGSAKDESTDRAACVQHAIEQGTSQVEQAIASAQQFRQR